MDCRILNPLRVARGLPLWSPLMVSPCGLPGPESVARGLPLWSPESVARGLPFWSPRKVLFRVFGQGCDFIVAIH